MGIKGLETFLCGNKAFDKPPLPDGTRNINIRDEIQQWKKINGDKPAIIVVDTLNLISRISSNADEVLCAGRHQKYLKMFGKMFNDLRKCGATLVFFCDLNVQQFKVKEWLERRNGMYTDYLKIYDAIDDGKSVKEMLETGIDTPFLQTALDALTSQAAAYGTLHYTPHHECDSEIAKYANENDAIAVLADDTDFLIFAGEWRYWSVRGVNLRTLDTIEYNRKALCEHLSLSVQHLPLFATLSGNDFTKVLFTELRDFYRSLQIDGTEEKFTVVAKYVREFKSMPFHISDGDIKTISARAFANANSPKMCQLIANSIKSYSADYKDLEITDPLMTLASGSCLLYEKLNSSLQTLQLAMYDFPETTKSYTEIVSLLLRKQMGILWQPKNDPNLNIEFLAKWSHEEDWCCKLLKPIYPPSNFFEMPPLISLLFDKDDNMESTLNTTRWNLLAWTLSLKREHLEKIKSLPKEYRMIATTLLYLIQQEQINTMQADMILIAESKVLNGQASFYNCSDQLNSYFVRVAHLYGLAYREMRSVFLVTGLTSFVNIAFQFDGVAFHHLNVVCKREPKAFNTYIKQIENYRIYCEQ